MLPIILSITPIGDGSALVVVSVRPGRRLQLVVPAELVTAAGFADTVALLASKIERKGTP